MHFARAVAAVAAALTIAFSTTADAQEKRVRMNMGGAFPGAMAILGPGQIAFAERVKKMSGGSVDLRFSEPGALVPASQYFDAVAAGSLDSAWTSLGFFTGKDIAFAMFSSVPFGPEMGEYLGWMKHGGGEKMMQELAAKYNVEVMLCGSIAPEASGWFRREIKSIDDLKGLKMRFFGLGAIVMQKLGVATQLLQAGEIFQALQLGTIDATEFSMPAMDLTLGFHQVAKHYYFPGWHQMSTFLHLIVSKQKWAELSEAQKEIVRAGLRPDHRGELRGRRGRAGQGDQGNPGQGRHGPLLAEGNPRGLSQDLARGRRGTEGQEPRIRESVGLVFGLPRGIQDLARARLPEVAAVAAVPG